MTPNLLVTAKAVLRGKFIGILGNKQTNQINNLNLYLKELEKEEQTKLKVRNHNYSGKDFANRGLSSQGYGFSSGHAWM